jgi:hypothetical protein
VTFLARTKKQDDMGYIMDDEANNDILGSHQLTE